jgi:hypothetical protein
VAAAGLETGQQSMKHVVTVLRRRVGARRGVKSGMVVVHRAQSSLQLARRSTRTTDVRGRQLGLLCVTYGVASRNWSLSTTQVWWRGVGAAGAVSRGPPRGPVSNVSKKKIFGANCCWATRASPELQTSGAAPSAPGPSRPPPGAPPRGVQKNAVIGAYRMWH